MYEVEVKVPADHERVRDRLAAIDADAHGEVVQEDVYYDAPHRNFVETDEALRIRSETTPESDTNVALTYKGPLVDEGSKTREEVETAIADGEKLAAILDNLGFDAAATVRKERDRFSHGKFTITLDAVDGLGEFVEVETDAPESDLRRAREDAFDVLERLDLDPDDQIRTSYLELLLTESNSQE